MRREHVRVQTLTRSRVAVLALLFGCVAPSFTPAGADERSLPDRALCAVALRSRCPDWTARWDTTAAHAPWSPDPMHDGMDFLGAADAAGGAVFATAASRGARGDLDMLTQAYDAGTGSLLWSSRYDAGNTERPHEAPQAVVADPRGGRVYVVGVEEYIGLFGGRILVIAYDAATGARLWKQSLYPSHAEGWAFGTAVAVAGDRILVGAESLNRQTADSMYYAFDAARGDLLWETRVVGGNWPRRIAYDAESDSFVGGSSTVAIRIDARDGAVRWVTPYGVPGKTGWVLDVAVSWEARVLVLVGTPRTEAFDVATGEHLWVDPAGREQNGWSVDVAPSGRAYVFSESCGCVLAHERDGQLLWATLADPALRRRAVAGGVVYDATSGTVFASSPGITAASHSGFVTTALVGDSGAEVWTARHGSAGDGAEFRPLDVLVAGRRVIVAGTFVSAACGPFGCPPGSAVAGGRDVSVLAYRI